MTTMKTLALCIFSATFLVAFMSSANTWSLGSFAVGTKNTQPKLPSTSTGRALLQEDYDYAAADYDYATGGEETTNDYVSDYQEQVVEEEEFVAEETDTTSRESVPAECDASSVDCFSFAVSVPPLANDVVAMMAADVAMIAYNTSAEVEDYAKNVLQATSIYELFDSATGTEAFVMVGSKTIMVAFRGTASEEDWDTNADVDLTDLGVHTGFANAVASVYPKLSDVLAQENPSNEKYVVLSGHSLGGALAVVAAAAIQSDISVESSVDAVYTFGSPRAGDSTFVASYDELDLSSKTLRYVHYKDPVPLIPPSSTGYRHVGRTIVLPLTKDSCLESSTVDFEYNTCEVNGGLLDAVSTAVGAFNCGWLTPLLGTGFCSGVGLAEMTADGVEPSVINVMCRFLDDAYFNGNLCCLAGDVAATGNFPTSYHEIEQYVGAMYIGCLDSCAAAQYETCGAGWTPEDEIEFEASTQADSDPVLEFTEEQTAEAQQTIRDAINQGDSTSSPSAYTGNSPSSSTSSGSGITTTTTGMATTSSPVWLVTVLVLAVTALLMATY